MPGDDNDGQWDLTPRELAHKLNSIHAWHANIRNDTAVPQRIKHAQKAVRRFMGFDVVAKYTQHLAKGMTD
jgi:hypothetical protein